MSAVPHQLKVALTLVAIPASRTTLRPLLWMLLKLMMTEALGYRAIPTALSVIVLLDMVAVPFVTEIPFVPVTVVPLTDSWLFPLFVILLFWTVAEAPVTLIPAPLLT